MTTIEELWLGNEALLRDIGFPKVTFLNLESVTLAFTCGSQREVFASRKRPHVRRRLRANRSSFDLLLRDESSGSSSDSAGGGMGSGSP